MEVISLPKTKNPLNSLGLWLTGEANKRGLLLCDIAAAAGTTPQNLSVITRTPISDDMETRWRAKFETAIENVTSANN